MTKNGALTAASEKVYQLLVHGRWFSPGTMASSTTKTGRHDIAEILLKVALKHQKSKINLVSHVELCKAITKSCDSHRLNFQWIIIKKILVQNYPIIILPQFKFVHEVNKISKGQRSITSLFKFYTILNIYPYIMI